MPKVQAAPVQVVNDASSEATVRASTLPETPELTPPGLKRSATAPGSQPVPPLGTVPPGPSGFLRGQPARPTFSSSTAAPSQAATGPRFGLTVMAGPARGQRFKLGAGGAQIGRTKGAILFPDDPFISPLHASLVVREGKLYVRDEASTSGVFVSISGTEMLPPGGTFCTGLRLFRYVGAIEPCPPWNRRDVVVYGAPLPNHQTHYAFEEVLLGGRAGRCIITPGPVLTIGQGRCDFAYPNDEGLAPRHCELAPMPTGVMIRDLSGGLGTFVRASGERALRPGDRIRIGQQTLQVDALS
jgi:pSer/pThr/pTyr-binding forkhead associated (FHA) protein